MASSTFYDALQAESASYYLDDKWEYEWALQHVQPSDRALDVGCGAGFSLELAERRGAAAVGIETAPIVRAQAVSRGFDAYDLSDSGFDVLVLCLGPSEPSWEAAVNRDVRGAYHGISFEYLCGSTVRSSSLWRRRWSRVVGLLGAARSIRRARARRRVKPSVSPLSCLGTSAMKMKRRGAIEWHLRW